MELYIIAGPNGVGQTTFARKFLPTYANCKNFVNADLIAQGMSPFSPEAAAIRAGRLVISEIGFFSQRPQPDEKPVWLSPQLRALLQGIAYL
jgi:predicted ABC-type ATPase